MRKIFLMLVCGLCMFTNHAIAENEIETFTCDTQHTAGVMDDKGVIDLPINRDIKVVKIGEGTIAVEHPKLAPVIMQMLPYLPFMSEPKLRFSPQFMVAVGYDRESATVVSLVIVGGEAAYTLNIGSMVTVIQAKCSE